MGAPGDDRDRLAAAATSLFVDRFGTAPAAVAIAPGRVNLIGEHTDYALLPVLPMAIDRYVAVAAGRGGAGRLRAISTQTVESVDAPPSTVTGWARYLAAALAAVDLDGGIDVAVAGNLPVASGLSSSSALTVATVAAAAATTGRPLEPGDLVGAAVTAERSLGVAGGEMDQTVIVHGRRGAAVRIDFLPPGRRVVPVPRDWAVLIADSGLPAPKAAAVRDAYNSRVVAARLGAALVASRTRIDPGSPPALGRLVAARHLGEVVDDLAESASAVEVAEATGVDVAALVGSPALVEPARPLPVRQVVRHVISEASRVDRFEEAMRGGDLVAAGILLDDSQRSLERFGVSVPRIEDLVGRLRAAGAAGARLTGAGFGGHVVAVCGRDRVTEVTAATGAVEVAACDGVTLR